MPWFFTIPEFIKKRACRYLLQHYLGQFLEEKINLNDLTVDLYNGTGTISHVPLNVEVSYMQSGVTSPFTGRKGLVPQTRNECDIFEREC